MTDRRLRVMIVEDDDTISLGLAHALDHEGYEVRRFDRGETALASVAEWTPHLVLLDIMLPGIDGIEVLRSLRQSHPDLPVIMLTAKGSEADRVEGLDAGADDYVAKPFSVRELVARVRARLRSALPDSAPIERFEFGAFVVDLRRRILQRHGEEDSRLTTHEAGVLSYLIAMRGKNVTREELLEKVWGYSPTMQTRTVDNQILKLRKKIEAVPADPKHIITVHGIGYRFEP